MNARIFRILILGYFVLALFGAFILEFNIMRNKSINFIDLFFTTTSALCVTGLTTANTATDFTIYGQAIILILIQIGGIGYMTIATLLVLSIGKKIDFASRELLKENINYPNYKGVVKFLKKIVIFVIIIEIIGAILLTIGFMQNMPIEKAIWHGFFHAISAFNNAGFSSFESSLVDYKNNFFINIVICASIVLGGLGYLVLHECYLYKTKQIRRLSVHSKLVLKLTFILITVSAILIFILEFDHKEVFGQDNIFSQILASFFLSVNLRTAGFNTIDVGLLHDQSLFLSSLLMIIGAAPGGTAGGIKMTAVAVLAVYAYSTLKNKDPIIFNRKIPSNTINKAFLVFIMATIYIIFSIMILSTTQDPENKMFIKILFEISSAFGTTGLSAGNGGNLSLSGNFDNFGKIYIIILMFLGRVGVIAFSFILINRNKKSHIQYPEEEVNL